MLLSPGYTRMTRPPVRTVVHGSATTGLNPIIVKQKSRDPSASKTILHRRRAAVYVPHAHLQTQQCVVAVLRYASGTAVASRSLRFRAGGTVCQLPQTVVAAPLSQAERRAV